MRATFRHLNPGEPIPAGPPRRGITKQGYVLLRWTVAPRVCVGALEHRVIAGVVTRDHVHHRNGIPSDNRPENLQIIDCGEHSALHHIKLIDSKGVGALYQQGLSSIQIAEHYGVSSTTVLRVLAERGMERREPSPRVPVRPSSILRLHFSGVRWEAIARELGVDKNVVKKLCKKMALVPFRSGPWRRDEERERI